MSAPPKVFIDTNVLVYAHDRTEVTKGPMASKLLIELMSKYRPLVSVQVLSEFYWAVTRRIKLPLNHAEASAEVERIILLSEVSSLSPETVTGALQLIAVHGLPLWDAQIVTSAKAGGAAIVLSEDFQHGRVLERIRFLNPFVPDFDLEVLFGKLS